MPEISALPALPAAPSIAGVSAATPLAPRDPGVPASDTGAASFLAQLQSALGSLGLLGQTPASTPRPAQQPADPNAPSSDQPAAEDSTVDLTTVLPEVLAALGFVPVPLNLPTEPVATGTTSNERVATAPTTLSLPMPLTSQASAQAAPAASAQPQPIPAQAQTATEAHVEPAPAHAAAATPIAMPELPSTPKHSTPAVDAAVLENLTSHVAPTAQREAAPHATQAAPVADPAVPTVNVAQPTPGQANFGQSDADADDAASDSSPVADGASTPGQSFPTMASTAAQRGEQASDVKPAHVVSQIAHQADLYRLPGGRGVRIQLHPDDLGGVGVTIKYGATGGLELHVNVEHAATAQLVQSGWNDLRDALSLQGIAPDRLIMSVSGPTDASLSDSSTGSRSDTGQASFGQASQQHQDRDNNNEARASRGWTSFGDAPTSATDDVRPTSATSSSRIDYRV